MSTCEKHQEARCVRCHQAEEIASLRAEVDRLTKVHKDDFEALYLDTMRKERDTALAELEKVRALNKNLSETIEVQQLSLRPTLEHAKKETAAAIARAEEAGMHIASMVAEIESEAVDESEWPAFLNARDYLNKQKDRQ